MRVKTENVQTDELLFGLAAEKITDQTPFCLERQVKCPYSKPGGCAADLCWAADEETRE